MHHRSHVLVVLAALSLGTAVAISCGSEPHDEGELGDTTSAGIAGVGAEDPIWSSTPDVYDDFDRVDGDVVSP